MEKGPKFEIGDRVMLTGSFGKIAGVGRVVGKSRGKDIVAWDDGMETEEIANGLRLAEDATTKRR